MRTKPDFDRIISANNFAIAVYAGFAILMVAVGAALFFGAVALPGGPVNDQIVKIGGGFVGTLGAFPVKEFLSRRRHNGGVRMISDLWDRVHATPKPEQAAVERLNTLVWKMLEKEALG